MLWRERGSGRPRPKHWCWLCPWSRIIPQSIRWCGYCLVVSGVSNAPWPCGPPSSQWPSLPQGRYDTVEEQRTGARRWLWSSSVGQGMMTVWNRPHEESIGRLSQTKVPRRQTGKHQQGNKNEWDPEYVLAKGRLKSPIFPVPTVPEATERSRTGEALCWGTRDHTAFTDQRPWRDKAILIVWIDCAKSPAAGP